MNTKVTSVRTVTSGKIASKKEMFEEGSPMKLCQEKWKDIQKSVQSKKWSECPPEFVGDFIRAMSNEFLLCYEEGAAEKSFQFLATSAFEDNNKQQINLDGVYLAGNASFHLTLSVEDEKSSDRDPVGTVEFEVQSKAETEDEVRDHLNEWASTAEAQTRLVFDPISQLPDEDIVRLVKQIEEKISGEDMYVLASAASIMIWWQMCENFNAETGVRSISGLHLGDKLIRPGQVIVARAKVNLLDENIQLNHSEDLSTYKVSSRPARRM